MFPILPYYFRHNVTLSGRQFTHTGPSGSNKNRHTNYQERIQSQKYNCFVFLCCDFHILILTICIIQIIEAQSALLIGILLAVADTIERNVSLCLIILGAHKKSGAFLSLCWLIHLHLLILKQQLVYPFCLIITWQTSEHELKSNRDYTADWT